MARAKPVAKRAPTPFALGVIALGAGSAVAVFACDVYDTSLLLPGGQGGDGGQGSTGSVITGEYPCLVVDECELRESSCGQQACLDGLCVIVPEPAGQVATEQRAGDCSRAVCDGEGSVIDEVDDTDLPDDGNPCTIGACSEGVPSQSQRSEGDGCDDGENGQFCNAEGFCVECLLPSQCPSGVCSAVQTCVSAQCGDELKNGQETDVDCGGPDCAPCGFGLECIEPTDCLSGVCTGGTCAASCTDGEQNQGETDVDCGGPCPPCALGRSCSVNVDCQSGSCGTGNLCTCEGSPLLISEVRTRGLGGATDEFFELYNPTNSPLTLTAEYRFFFRSDSAAGYGQRWNGSNQVLGARRHILVAHATGYGDGVAADATYTTGLPDSGSAVLGCGPSNNIADLTTVIDALCFHCTTTQLNNILGGGHTCEGQPFNRGTSTICGQNVDRSMERRPGGAAGNGQDTGVSNDDFQHIEPSLPQNLASPPTPP